jgi:hypothetical protein
MNAQQPQLDAVQKTALGIVMEKGVVGGEELMAKSKTSDAELFTAMKELVRLGVVNSNTVLYSADVLRNTYFNLNPSAMSVAKDLLSS